VSDISDAESSMDFIIEETQDESPIIVADPVHSDNVNKNDTGGGFYNNILIENPTNIMGYQDIYIKLDPKDIIYAGDLIFLKVNKVPAQTRFY
jgi:hypothetical protein